MNKHGNVPILTYILNNYRPVSNLAFVAKIIEKVVASRLNHHLMVNNLHEPFQSAYRVNHSTETAMLRVQNDIIRALGDNKVVLLVLIDLSAAFDTDPSCSTYTLLPLASSFAKKRPSTQCTLMTLMST